MKKRKGDMTLFEFQEYCHRRDTECDWCDMENICNEYILQMGHSQLVEEIEVDGGEEMTRRGQP